ncbi:MAG: HAD family hydrolase [Clostridia bacterium]|nr:HAD family hydrolase [Clostridia bacterium]
MYNTILFDLDGTLTDSARGITNSVAYALTEFGLRFDSKEELRCFIGPPLIKMFIQVYGVSEEEARDLVKKYREYYAVTGIFENDLYENVEDLLSALYSDGKKLILATSKPEHFAVKILEHFGIAKYFSHICGATMDEKRTEKDAVIAYALDCAEITDVSSVVMVGDRKYDILGAKSFGIDSIGVLYGYGSREELESAGATHIAQSVNDIFKFV